LEGDSGTEGLNEIVVVELGSVMEADEHEVSREGVDAVVVGSFIIVMRVFWTVVAVIVDVAIGVGDDGVERGENEKGDVDAGDGRDVEFTATTTGDD